MIKPLGKNEKRIIGKVEALCFLNQLIEQGYEQGKKESLLLRDAEKKALAKTIYGKALEEYRKARYANKKRTKYRYSLFAMDDYEILLRRLSK